jgi:ferric-dicitrate binding protein FerR (iron transport regulator)
MLRTSLALLIACACGFAADAPTPIATAADGAVIAAGAPIAAGDAAQVLALAGAPGSTITLAPGSLAQITEVDGGIEILLDAGTVSVDLPDRGPWTGLRVTGAKLTASVIGTAFVVERTRRGTDLVSVVRGQVRVSLRSDVARILGRAAPADIDLRPGDAVEGTNAGFTTPTAPEMLAAPVAAAASASVIETVQQNVSTQLQEQVVETILTSTLIPAPPAPPAD